MGDVRSLTLVPKSDGVPDEDLIANIEALLERVKSGAVQGIAYAEIYADGGFRGDWDGGVGSFATLGAIAMLQHDFADAIKAEHEQTKGHA